MAFAHLIYISLFVVLIAYLIHHHVIFPRFRLPPGKPIVGNLFDIPLQHSWLKFKQWADIYGSVFSINLAGQTHVIVSTDAAANDLLRDRGKKYSCREQFSMVTDIVSGNLRPLLLPYNDQWRRCRKFIHRLCMESAAESYQPIQELEVKHFLYDFLSIPSKYEIWLERFSASLVMRLCYGHPIQTGQEAYIRLLIEHVHECERVASPGAYYVDTFPLLAKLPDWLAPFKRYGKMLHERELSLFRTLLGDVKEEMKVGRAAETSFARRYLEDEKSAELSFDEAAYVIGTLFEAGIGTTAAAMMSFILAMVLHPEWQALVADELDKVVGERMPTFQDLTNLPKVKAVVKETLRWRPVTSGGIPHKSTEDDIYNGYFIPAGTNIHWNQWAIHRDPILYPSPSIFDPSRWLSSQANNSLTNFSTFGYGRRMCPGQHIASRSLHLLAASIAWASIILKAKDENGQEVEVPEYAYTSGMNSQPKPFQFRLEPRGTRRWEVVRAEWETARREDPLRGIYEYELGKGTGGEVW